VPQTGQEDPWRLSSDCVPRGTSASAAQLLDGTPALGGHAPAPVTGRVLGRLSTRARPARGRSARFRRGPRQSRRCGRHGRLAPVPRNERDAVGLRLEEQLQQHCVTLAQARAAGRRGARPPSRAANLTAVQGHVRRVALARGLGCDPDAIASRRATLAHASPVAGVRRRHGSRARGPWAASTRTRPRSRRRAPSATGACVPACAKRAAPGAAAPRARPGRVGVGLTRRRRDVAVLALEANFKAIRAEASPRPPTATWRRARLGGGGSRLGRRPGRDRRRLQRPHAAADGRRAAVHAERQVAGGLRRRHAARRG
jgi:hypothetical protein